jgi:hypothetical protein
MNDDVIEQLGKLASDIALTLTPQGAFDQPPGSLLPSSHRKLLEAMNGFSVFHGAFRLLGLSREPEMDIETWNSHDVWRFAWDERIEPYLCFGETAWGDQYAYRMRPGNGLGDEVYFLEGTLLRPEVLAPTFAEFVTRELLRVGADPYDPMTRAAVAGFGPIAPREHWVYSPSLALGGAESLDHVVKLAAIVAMTFAGDIATALVRSAPGTQPTTVTPWRDERGRDRLRVCLSAS